MTNQVGDVFVGVVAEAEAAKGVAERVRKAAKWWSAQHGYVTFDTDVMPADRQRAVIRMLGLKFGHYDVTDEWPVTPESWLMTVVEELKEFKWADSLRLHLEERLAEQKEALKEKLAVGKIEFMDLPTYMLGREVAFESLDSVAAGAVLSVELKTSFFGPYYRVMVEVVHVIDGAATKDRLGVTVYHWKGLKPVDELPVKLLDAGEKVRLQERGESLLKLTDGGAKYMAYKGQLEQPSWWESKHYRADGRVMVDAAMMKQQAKDLHDKCRRYVGLNDDRRGGSDDSGKFEMDVADCWRLLPHVCGFSFKVKQWGIMSMDGLKEIAWRDDAFDKLVLGEKEKELVKAVVEGAGGGDFTDIVEDKGGGFIFLLHGPPGQGKTLTAETVAEALKRPLYSVTVGELGVSPDRLEDRLRQILDIATTWNAVLLLDEADIFLEARNEQDVLRNAMVGVFLRLLEYHQGVLFLTTNRVKNIDLAFYSRISVPLKFGTAGAAKREAIWVNLLDAAGIVGLDTERLAGHDVNGRQIKNAIRLAQRLSASRGVKIDEALMGEVMALTTKFEV